MKEIDLGRVDLNLLVTFDVLMSEGSVTRAPVLGEATMTWNDWQSCASPCNASLRPSGSLALLRWREAMTER